MLVTRERDGDVRFTLARYSSLRDFYKQAKSRKGARGQIPTDWAGGTWDYFERGISGNVTDFSDAARAKVTQFGNVALRDYAVDYEYNVVHGALDYAAMEAGNPACMYGPTITETDRSPVHIYIDTWTSGMIDPDVMRARGIGILALVQALSIYRPVQVYITKTSHFSPKREDTLQIVQLPTQPMDLARATFALCSPTVNRIGLLSSIHSVHDCNDFCPSPRFSNGPWASARAPNWVAERLGVQNKLFMPGSISAKFWNNDTKVIAWIKEQIEKFVE